MNREQVKAALPIIQAFAEGRPVQFRNLPLSTEWITLNPNTTEFRLSEFDPREWRVDPGQDEPDLRSRLSESEAAVRVLSGKLLDCLVPLAALVIAGEVDPTDDRVNSIAPELRRQLSDAEQRGRDALSSLPSSAKQNAESHRRMRELLAAYEQWEADLVMSSEAWQDSLPRFTQELYDRWMELQTRRNEILNPEVASAGKLHQELQGEK